MLAPKKAFPNSSGQKLPNRHSQTTVPNTPIPEFRARAQTKERPKGIGANRRDNRARRVSKIVANRRQSSRIVAHRRESSRIVADRRGSSRIVAFSFGQKWRFSFSLVRRPWVCPTCRAGAWRCDNTWSNTRVGMRIVTQIRRRSFMLERVLSRVLGLGH